MDGTLVDSGAIVERHWRLFAGRHGIDAETFLGEVHGIRSADVIARVAPWLDAGAEAARLDAAEEADVDGLRAVPGAATLLAGLPPDRWAVVTSAHRSLAVNRLGALGLPLPQVLVCGDEIARGKPDPEGYLAAAERLGTPPGACVVVEDAPVGVEAAHRAGMRVVALTTNYPEAALAAADARIPDLRTLEGALGNLGWSIPTS
jgi:sugar-phosphatase